MAHKKSGGSAKNLRDSKPKYLGTKLYDGERAQTGMVIVRQRGTRIIPGANVSIGKDHTLFATSEGVIKFTETRKRSFDGRVRKVKKVSVV